MSIDKADIKNKAIKASIWSIIDTFGIQAIKAVFALLIARQLFPNDYGLIGMIAIFISLPKLFVDSGFHQALIQKKNIDNEQFSSIFFLQIIISLIFYLLIFVFSEKISIFFNEPSLKTITRVIGVTILLHSFTLIYKTRAIKEINFKTLAIVNFVSTLLASSIALTMAYTGFGVWSLVFKEIINITMQLLLFVILIRWRPSLKFNIKKIKTLFNFGSKVFAGDLLLIISSNFSSAIIGKVYGATDLGFFTKGRQLQELFSYNLTNAINKVSYPTFSLIQDDSELLKRSYKQSILLLTFIVVPITTLLIIVAEPLITALLGEKWAGAIFFFKAFGFVGLLYPFQVINLNVLKIKGRSDLYLYLKLITETSLIVLIIVSSLFNIKAIAIVIILHSFFSLIINSYYSGKLIKYNLREQLGDVFPQYLTSAISFAILVFANTMIFNNITLVIVVFESIIFLILYFAVSAFFSFKGYEIFKTTLSTMLSFLQLR